jgi:hypothetical protein
MRTIALEAGDASFGPKRLGAGVKVHVLPPPGTPQAGGAPSECGDRRGTRSRTPGSWVPPDWADTNRPRYKSEEVAPGGPRTSHAIVRGCCQGRADFDRAFPLHRQRRNAREKRPKARTDAPALACIDSHRGRRIEAIALAYLPEDCIDKQAHLSVTCVTARKGEDQ